MIASSASSFGTGLALGAASMLSVGPNNLLMIREGLNRGRVVVVPSVVLFCYSGFIVSALGFSDEIARLPTGIRTFLTCLGVPALMYFSTMCFVSASNSRKVGMDDGTRHESVGKCVLRILAVLLCNPLMYIELLIVPASICAAMDSQADRVTFVVSLILTSSIYCFGFSFGARSLVTILRSSSRLAVFDVASGIVLFGLALFMMRSLSRSWS